MLNTRLLTVLAATGLTLGLAAAGARSGEPAPTPRADDASMAIGDPAPSFSLKDQDGAERPLADFLGKGKVALVFFRSADWCPFCRKQLTALQADIKSFQDANIQLVGISHDAPAILKK